MHNTHNLEILSKKIVNRDRTTWIDVWYDIQNNAVYSYDKGHCYHITTLINPCSASDIEKMVNRFMAL